MPVGLRLFLSKTWTDDPARCASAGVPGTVREPRTNPEIALAEIARVIEAGVRFGCVLADAGYGLSGPFRQGLSARYWRSNPLVFLFVPRCHGLCGSQN